MAKKTKNVSNVVLENAELKPQVIGYIYEKKTNLGRVVFIFVCFALVVYFINDISVIFNRILGRDTATTIGDNATTGKKPNNNNHNNNPEVAEPVYYEFKDGLSISESGLVLNNFKYNNNVLSFDANNDTNQAIDLTNKKYFLEVYTQNKTLISRLKVDFNNIEAHNKVSFNLDLTNSFYYLVLITKTVDDYPSINFPSEGGIMNFTCSKSGEQINYRFTDEKLTTIKDTISDSNVTDQNYANKYTFYQKQANTYNSLDGFMATFNGTANGYSIIINIDLTKAKGSDLTNKYYYSLNTEAKVVNFEMQTYGFTCR